MTENNRPIEFVLKQAREHLFMVILALCLLPLGAASIMSLIIGSDSEIIYDEHTIFAICNLQGAPKGRDCAGSYEVIIGNTGKKDETVHLTWPAALGNWKQDQEILNIAADEPREHDPRISCNKIESAYECVLEQFSPGTLLIFKMSCLGCSGADLQWIDRAPAKLQTSAKIYQGDPRVNVFWRRIHGLLQLII